MSRGLEKGYLIRNAGLLCLLRYGVVALMLLVGIPVALLLGMITSFYQAVLLGVYALLYNSLGYYYLRRRAAVLTPRSITAITLGLLLADILGITWVVHISGGIVSAFTFFYLFPILASVMVLSESLWVLFVVSAAVNICYDALLFLEYAKILPLPEGYAWLPQAYGRATTVAAFGIAIPMAFWILTIFVWFGGRLIRKKRSEIEADLNREITALKAELEKKLEQTNAELYQRNIELTLSEQRYKQLFEEHQQVDKELKEREERYTQIFKDTFDMIQSVGLDGKFIFVNQAWRETLGYSEDDLPKLNMWDIVCEESREHCQQLFSKVMAGEAVKDVQARFRTKDGRAIEVEGHSSPRLVGGKVVASHGFFRDITHRKQAEKEIRRRMDELENMNKVMVGREIKMIELEKEVNALLKEMGKELKYKEL